MTLATGTDNGVQSNLKTHKLLNVTVDYLDVPFTDYLKTSQWLAPGHENDALLLTALVKAGARDTRGAQVQVPDRWSRENQITLREEDLSEGIEVDMVHHTQTRKHLMRPTLVSFTEAIPQFNADGTITVLLRLVLGPPPQGYPVPMTSEGYQCLDPTFRDGQTLLVSNSVTHPDTGPSMTHLTFVRVTTSTKPPSEDH